jgi:hypothetical protein
MRSGILLGGLLAALAAAMPAQADEDVPGQADGDVPGQADGDAPATLIVFDQADLTQLNVARAQYDSAGGMGEAYYAFEGRVWARWETDFPQAEHNFARRLAELTRITVGREPARRRFTDQDLGDFPLLFMSDPGYMRFTSEEAEALGAYLHNGGFLWVDDFWGDAEWASFERFMREALPGIHWREVPLDHPIFHTVFEFDEMPQIPARSFATRSGLTAEPAWFHRYPAGSLVHPAMRGFFDAEGRLLAIGTHNTDIFDGWEREAYGSWYFERFSTLSYKLGVNVLTYVLTH